MKTDPTDAAVIAHVEEILIYLLMLLVAVTALLAGNLKRDGLPGVDAEIDPAGTRFTTEPAGKIDPQAGSTDFYGNQRAEVLW